jgi:adenylate kinase family enzyme
MISENGMKKILVVGSGGAGKSTFSRRLGKILNIEVIHLDTLYWNPGWVETPKPVWRNMVEELINKDSWIIDGNYSGTLDIRVDACDTVIFLDIARLICLSRVIKRVMLYRNGRRPDMAEGCRERLTLEFVRWIWNYPKRTRPKVLKLLKDSSHRKNVIRLRNQADIDNFLIDIKKTSGKPV